jgi:hypothetical protein
MTGALLKGLKAVFVFGYGLFSFAIYVLIGIRRGFFFKGTTEKERLELQLGQYYNSPLGLGWQEY